MSIFIPFSAQPAQCGKAKSPETTYLRHFRAFCWSEWRDLNSRPLDPQSSTLPAALHPDLQRSIKPCLNRIPNPEGKVKCFVKIPAANLLCSACFRCSRNNHRIRCTVCDTPHFSHHSTCFLSVQKEARRSGLLFSYLITELLLPQPHAFPPRYDAYSRSRSEYALSLIHI